MKIIAPLLAVLVLVSTVALVSSEVQGKPQTLVTTDPAAFPDVGLARAFDFTVKVEDGGGGSLQVFLILEAVCPDGGVATLSGDAAGDACEGPIETLSKDLTLGSATWAFTVVYLGSIGTYQWTIQARGDEEDDDDCGPGFWKNHEELWDGGADDVTATYKIADTFNAAFGVTPADSDLGVVVKLLEALDVAGGKLMALNRHAVAALLNADSADNPLSVSEVIALYKDAVGAVGGPETISSALEILTTSNAQSDCEFDD